MSIAQTNRNYSYDWWTPTEWLDWVSKTLGTNNWFDPCPQDWGGGLSGLDVAWEHCTYVNHPGSRGSTHKWWRKAMNEVDRISMNFIWCAFNHEQLRYMYPAAHELDGYLVLPRDRIKFIWGGPDDASRKLINGQPGTAPGNWAVFWTNVKPAKPPKDCIIHRTGKDLILL